MDKKDEQLEVTKKGNKIAIIGIVVGAVVSIACSIIVPICLNKDNDISVDSKETSGNILPYEPPKTEDIEPPETVEPEQSETGLKVGDIIPFGGYDWRVLDVQGDKALIITKNIIELRAYHDTLENTTWEKCDLRKYLNGDFLGNFSASEIAQIIPCANQNPDNPWWGTDGGADTEDKVFLLSLQEVCRYFGDSRDQLNSSDKKALAEELKREYWNKGKVEVNEWKDFYLGNKIYVTDENDAKRVAKLPNSENFGWHWLRSAGGIASFAAFVGGGGGVGVGGYGVDIGNGGVRPALWLDLTKL